MPLFHDLTDVPDRLETDALVIRAVRETDAELDYEALMESREFLRLWEGNSWPEDDFTLDDNRDDLRTMERRHAARDSFGFTVINPAGTECFGCVYIFPTDAAMFARCTITPVDDAAWPDHDAAVYFWVRTGRLKDALDRTLLDTLGRWLTDDWAFERVLFVTNEHLGQQVTLFKGAGLPLRFRVNDPTARGKFLAFGTASSATRERSDAARQALVSQSPSS